MKNTKAFFVLLLIVAISLLLIGCQSNKVNLRGHIVDEVASEQFRPDGHVWYIKYYVSGIDMSTIEKIDVKINGTKCYASASGTDYFEVTYIDEDYEWAGISLDECYGYVKSSGSTTDCTCDAIGETLLIGCAMVVIGSVAYAIALGAYSVTGMYVVTGVVGLFVLATYFALSVWQGIILTVFLLIYLVVTEGIVKNFFGL